MRLILLLSVLGSVTPGFAQERLPTIDVHMHAMGVIERSIRTVEEAPFLSKQQKRDILYNNAARFLRLSEEEIASWTSMT